MTTGEVYADAGDEVTEDLLFARGERHKRNQYFVHRQCELRTHLRNTLLQIVTPAVKKH